MAIGAIRSCKGEASVIMIRGKKRIGYELEVKIAIDASKIGEGSVVLKIRELCDDSGTDPEYSVKIKKVNEEGVK